MSSPSLAMEILLQIAGYVESKADLLSIRLASRDLCVVATPAAFHTFCMVTPEHAQYLVETHSNGLGIFIEELVLDRTIDDEHFDSVIFEAMSKMGDVLGSMLSTLGKFPSLRVLKLHFSSDVQQEEESEPSAHLVFQRKILAAVSSGTPPPSFTSLSLRNIIAVSNDPVFPTKDFHRLLGAVTEYELSVLSDLGYEGVHLQFFIDFWEQTVGPHLLAPAKSATSVTLVSDQWVGFYPTLALTRDIFPRLSHLSLTQICFYDNDQPEDDTVLSPMQFILHRKDTLKSLELVACPILFDVSDEVTFPWSAVWRHFESELVHLESLVVDWAPPSLPWLEDDDNFSKSYVMAAPGSGLLPAETYGREDMHRTDGEALARLIQMMNMNYVH